MYTRYSLFASLALSRSALFLPSFHSFSNARIYMLRANFFVAFFEILRTMCVLFHHVWNENLRHGSGFRVLGNLKNGKAAKRANK
jgi:hypothetical protein